MPNVIKKKILTEDDLLKFCQEQDFARFSSKDTGYQLAVKVPTTFEVDENVDNNHRGMMKLRIRIFHTGLNRNKSYVSREAAEKAMNTIADRPVLAAIHKLDDGTWDFEGHEIEIVKDENGNEELRYIESQVGSFSSEPAFWEHDDELDKDYVCAYAYISEEYTKTCDIIRKKQGSKNSCELFIDELSYNAKEKYLELNDFYVNASTLLGSHDDGTQIEEGMQGSRADIVDFSVKNNSIKFQRDEKMIELLENLNKTLSNFNKYHIKEGGDEETMFEKLLEKYGKAVEDITFDYENLSDEELEQKFAELFDEENPDGSEGEPSNDGKGDDGSGAKGSADDGEGSGEGESPEGNPDTGLYSVNPEKYSITMSDGSVKDFSLSLDEITFALYTLVNNMYADDDAWYSVTVYEDNTLIMSDWWNNKYFKQSYTRDGDNFSLVGDRVAVHSVWVTDDEETALNEMRSNYAALKEFKETAEKNELRGQKEEILYSKKYSVLAEKDKEGNFVNASFAELVENMDNYSLTDLEKEVKVIFADHVADVGNFSLENPSEKPATVKLFNNPNRKPKPKKRYGNLFD